MKKAILLVLVILLLTACSTTEINIEDNTETNIGDSTETADTNDYEGTWMRQGTYVGGSQVSSASATMILTEDTFDSSTTDCANSGSINVQGSTMVMVVEESNCPSIINVGSTVTSTYSVSGTQLTFTNSEYGADVKEIYNKA